MFENTVQATILRERLEQVLGKTLDLRINNNRSTMLSVRWESTRTKVSLHKMFLNAPQNIMQELTCYLKREHKVLGPSVKAYIEKNLQQLDYSHELDLDKLNVVGKVYNLKELYHSINQHYFDNELKLHITWFGKALKKNSSKITFGLFYDPLKLIKINKLLDHVKFPRYVVEYVIYHEMLHYVCPSYVDEKGQKHIHSKAFKKLERQFEHFELAEKWIKSNLEELFTTNFN